MLSLSVFNLVINITINLSIFLNFQHIFSKKLSVYFLNLRLIHHTLQNI